MKKFSLLIVLCMLLTIGGVYATWIYSGNQVDPQTQPFISQMGDIDHEGNAGSYSFTNDGLGFAVEPTTQEEKVTSIVWNDKSVILTFTPKLDISDAALEDALNATIVVELASDTAGTYQERTIYTIKQDFAITLNQGSWQGHDTNDDNIMEYYTFVINKTNISESIEIYPFELPTEDDYADFKAIIQNVKFRLKVTPSVA